MDLDSHCPDCFQAPAANPVCSHCGYDARTAYRDNSLLAPFTALGGGRYLIGRVLGRPGGYGVVYAGWQVGLSTPVAIKEFFPYKNGAAIRDKGLVAAAPGDEARFDLWRDRFLQEARLLASLHIPRIQPRIVHAREIIEENGTAYLVMERLHGATLAEHLGGWDTSQRFVLRRRLPPGDAWPLLLAALEALAVLHGRAAGHIIHRDLTPNNLFLEGHRLDDVKLLDFGLARKGDSPAGSVTSAGAGSPGFRAPEQADPLGKAPITTAADCYTLAASLYCALTGRAPPPADARRAGSPLSDLKRLPGLDASLAELLMDCLALDYRARPRNAMAMLQRIAAMTLMPALEPVPEPPPAVSPPRELAQDPRQPAGGPSSEGPKKTGPPGDRVKAQQLLRRQRWRFWRVFDGEWRAVVLIWLGLTGLDYSGWLHVVDFSAGTPPMGRVDGYVYCYQKKIRLLLEEVLEDGEYQYFWGRINDIETETKQCLALVDLGLAEARLGAPDGDADEAWTGIEKASEFYKNPGRTAFAGLVEPRGFVQQSEQRQIRYQVWYHSADSSYEFPGLLYVRAPSGRGFKMPMRADGQDYVSENSLAFDERGQYRFRFCLTVTGGPCCLATVVPRLVSCVSDIVEAK